MDIHYTLMHPAKSATLLVDTPVPRPSQAAVARLLLQSQRAAEQVGFVEPSACARRRLQMMGGALCGNAAASLAALLCLRDGLSAGQTAELALETSGTEGVLRCRVDLEDGRCRCAVALPRPDRIGQVSVAGVARPAVFFPGAVYCVVPAGALDRADAESAVGPLCRHLGAAVCGLLFFDEDALSFTPLLYAAATDTRRWARSCASGSAALGAWLAHRSGASRAVSLRQPGGVIHVSATWRGRVSSLVMAETVGFGPSGSLILPL